VKEAPEFYAVRVLGVPHPPIVTKADSAVGAPAGATVIAWRLSTVAGEAYLVERSELNVRPA